MQGHERRRLQPECKRPCVQHEREGVNTLVDVLTLGWSRPVYRPSRVLLSPDVDDGDMQWYRSQCGHSILSMVYRGIRFTQPGPKAAPTRPTRNESAY